MTGDDEPSRDLAALVVPQDGRLAATGDRYEPYRLVDADGVVVAAAGSFFRDLLAAGRAEATVCSYGMDLLRWFRFLRAVRVPWDQATRAEARDFSRWLQVAGKQARPHWRGGDGAGVAAVPAGGAYAPSVRAHSETVLRAFYDCHLDAGSGPLVNPFPLDRSRRGGRAHAHQIHTAPPATAYGDVSGSALIRAGQARFRGPGDASMAGGTDIFRLLQRRRRGLVRRAAGLRCPDWPMRLRHSAWIWSFQGMCSRFPAPRRTVSCPVSIQ